ncbi:MAG: hypothetical protein H6577_00800 [Lewinellaceae bacterium]|nr:hypothetical protein [Saprospiraceae bacterium]MCB9336646.1 hypothetical protein [Lewinellaceae bacterium]
MYDENHNGIPFTGTLNDNDLQGFLTCNELQTLLAPAGCVGIRVYNAVAGTNDSSRRVIAVGIRENGSEFENLYQLSGSFTPGSIPTGGRQANDRQEAVDLTGRNVSPSLHFAAFFSKKMVNGLLAGNNGQAVDGIGFFVVNLGGGIFSHVGMAYVNARQAANSSIQSDMPCPDHCARLVDPTATDTATADTFKSDNTGNDAGIYLQRW